MLKGTIMRAQPSGPSARSAATHAQDSLKIPGIPVPFTWADRPKTFSVPGDRSITITAAKGTDQYCFVDGTYYIHNAPKFLMIPGKDFIFSCKIKTGLANLYEGGGLLIYRDTLNWVKLLFERNDDHTIMVTSNVVTNKVTDDSYHIPIANKEVYLKLAKSGTLFCLYYSLDGKKWEIIRNFAFPGTGDLQIGLCAQSPEGPSCTVEFSAITYRPVAFRDFLTGE